MSVDIRIEYQPQVLHRMHQSVAAATYQIRLVIDKYQMKYQYFSRARAKEEAPRNVNPTVPQQSGPSSVDEKMQRKCSDSSARRRFNHAPGSILINTRVLALQSWKDCLSDHHISSPPRPSPFRERPDPCRNLIPPLRRLRNPVPAFHAFPSFQVHCPQFRLRRGAAHIPTFQWWRNGERRSGMALPRTCERAHALATGA